MDAGKRSLLQQEHRLTQQGGRRDSEEQVGARMRSNADVTRLNRQPSDELLRDRLLLSVYRADNTRITNAAGNTNWKVKQCPAAAYRLSSPFFTCLCDSA